MNQGRIPLTTKVFLLLPLFLATSCQPITGYLKVLSNMNIFVTETTEDCNPMGGAGTDICVEDEEPETIIKAKTLSPGEYRTNFSFQSKREVLLSIRTSKYDVEEISITIPEGKNIPQYAGEFELSSNESGQPWNLRGLLDTEEEDSQLTYTTESCTYTKRVWECHWNGNSQVCGWKLRTFFGHREVEYYFHYTTTNLSISYFDPSNRDLIAQFKGDRKTREKIYTYQGRCF